MRRAAWCVLLAAISLGAQAPPIQTNDSLLRAMQDELKRSGELSHLGLVAPYLIEYRTEDTVTHGIGATLGALLETVDNAYRVPSVRVRVGSYEFDNTNHIYSEAYAGRRYDPERLPLDDNYLAFREVYWLATDRAFKTAEDAIARKRSSLKNVSLPDALPDFSKAPAAQLILPIERKPVALEAWKKEIIKLSALFGAYPQVLSSGVDLQSSQSTNYVLNSEGTVLRLPEDLSYIHVTARGLAADGTDVHDSQTFQAFEAADLPGEQELTRASKEIAEHVVALSQAPAGESYDGPVLFEAPAAAQLFEQLLGDNLKLTRKPIADPGRVPSLLSSELENRVGSRILPDWMDVVDDSTQTKFAGHTLLGHYLYDVEGVAPQPVTLVEKGVLKTFLLTRTPVFKDFPGSNGHARFTGMFGDAAPGFGNLFIRASQTTPAAALKQKLIDMSKERNKPYGILIRKLDSPGSASGPHGVASPLLAYRVYPDGREELVRSLQFHGVSTRSFKDIVSASDENYVLDLIDSNPRGNFISTASVIAPAVLFEELELAPIEEETPKPPIVPPPALGAQAVTAAVLGR
ncbi:MAG: metallopeptidase TldD-related protein [Bryobacteraceae bacterium]